MPVNLSPPDPATLLPVAGLTLGIASAGIKRPGRKDLLLMSLAPGATVAGVFTQNRFCAAPVTVCREHLASGAGIRALVVNTGNANAGTGEEGLRRARATCEAVSSLLAIRAEQVLPFSTGVILEPLPADKLIAALPAAVADLKAANWADAAQAIMTTDLVPKAASRRLMLDGVPCTVTGIAKGSGMIHPNMATMLAFVATDAPLAQDALEDLLRQAVRESFNGITVDGDTSTNDACILIATGAAPIAPIRDHSDPRRATLQEAISGLMTELAQAIVRDGEGATKFITVRVEGGRDEAECKQVAYAIARSPLVKTAFFASDPNLGRILAAVGYAGISDLEVDRVKLWLGDVLVAEHGGRAAAYREEQGAAVMARPEITVRVALHRGAATATVWTCDFSYDYVRINAEYRT